MLLFVHVTIPGKTQKLMKGCLGQFVFIACSPGCLDGLSSQVMRIPAYFTGCAIWLFYNAEVPDYGVLR